MSFKNTLIILTSNVGSRAIASSAGSSNAGVFGAGAAAELEMDEAMDEASQV